ncbi:hypothetical protein BRADI_1g26391v3, partial [Brachypodium distachyon]
KATSRGVRGDRLSELPDDILLNILERVDTIDALRTCILSKRMLQLPTMLSRLDIDICFHYSHGQTFRPVVWYNNAVAGVPEKILSARNSEIPIHKLSVRFYVRPAECFSISKALARTMAIQKVDDAEFVLITEKSSSKCTHEDLLCYAKLFNTCLGDSPPAFASLTRLRLRNMRFGELYIPNILSTCKRLKSLRLSFCDAGVRSVLQVEHSQLVELLFQHGKFGAVHLKCLPKLQSVIFVGWSYHDHLTFGYVPQLSKISLEEMGTLPQTDISLLGDFYSCRVRSRPTRIEVRLSKYSCYALTSLKSNYQHYMCDMTIPCLEWFK